MFGAEAGALEGHGRIYGCQVRLFQAVMQQHYFTDAILEGLDNMHDGLRGCGDWSGGIRSWEMSVLSIFKGCEKESEPYFF